jgi:cold shock CspA family protein
MTGRVSYLSETYGFLRGEDGDRYFFAATACVAPFRFEDCAPGARVSFTLGRDRKNRICADRIWPLADGR